MNNITISCPICSQEMKFSGWADYYDRKSEFKTPMYYCNLCDIYYRDIQSKQLINHYYAASYVQRENETKFFYTREGFLKIILAIIGKYFEKKKVTDLSRLTLVDFGSAYGHLLELAQQQGFKVIGVELNKDLIKYCTEKGFTVFEKVDDLPGKVDVLAFIDSFYYLRNPVEILSKVNTCLKEDGVVVTRITNRNLYPKLTSKLLYQDSLNILGDSTISYSLKAIKRLLDLTGFKLIQVIPDYGQGKKQDLKLKLVYLLTYLFTLLSAKKIILTPGIIVVGKKTRTVMNL